MSKGHSDSALFHKCYLKVIIAGAFLFLFYGQSLFAVVSAQQCDVELVRYCPNSQYPTAELKIECVKKKQNLFTNTCVRRILGFTQIENENQYIDDVDNIDTAENNQADNTQSQDVLELDLNQQQNDILAIEQKDIKISQKNERIKQQDEQITNLTKMVLNRNCTTEMQRFCKTRIRRQKLLLKESLEKCIDKMINHEYYLTINCRSALLNILSKTSDKQYYVYRAGNVSIVSGQSLRNVKKKLEN